MLFSRKGFKGFFAKARRDTELKFNTRSRPGRFFSTFQVFLFYLLCRISNIWCKILISYNFQVGNLFLFRTEQINHSWPMVLVNSGRVGSCPIFLFGGVLKKRRCGVCFFSQRSQRFCAKTAKAKWYMELKFYKRSRPGRFFSTFQVLG